MYFEEICIHLAIECLTQSKTYLTNIGCVFPSQRGKTEPVLFLCSHCLIMACLWLGMTHWTEKTVFHYWKWDLFKQSVVNSTWLKQEATWMIILPFIFILFFYYGLMTESYLGIIAWGHCITKNLKEVKNKAKLITISQWSKKYIIFYISCNELLFIVDSTARES